MVMGLLEQRFRDRIIVQRFTNCWLWSGAVDKNGYGQYTIKDKSIKAHRHAYETIIGPISEGNVIDHGCRTRCCVNPRHMEAVTNRENVLRGLSFAVTNKRKTHCKRGHALSGPNLLLVRHGRSCKTCQLAAKRKHMAKPEVKARTQAHVRERYRIDGEYRERMKAFARAQYHKGK